MNRAACVTSIRNWMKLCIVQRLASAFEHSIYVGECREHARGCFGFNIYTYIRAHTTIPTIQHAHNYKSHLNISWVKTLEIHPQLCWMDFMFAIQLENVIAIHLALALASSARYLCGKECDGQIGGMLDAQTHTNVWVAFEHVYRKKKWNLFCQLTEIIKFFSRQPTKSNFHRMEWTLNS